MELVAPYAPERKGGRPTFAVQTMLRIHFMQQWFTLNDPAMEDALHDTPRFREFASLGWDKFAIKPVDEGVRPVKGNTSLAAGTRESAPGRRRYDRSSP